MPYPNYPTKHRHESLLHPDEDPLASAGDEASIPPTAVVTYQDALFESIVAERAGPASEISHLYDHHVLPETDGRVGIVGNFGFGAPVTAIVVESLIAAGVDRIVSVGWAGSLRPPSEISLGDLVVADRALRDEGTSHHYLPARQWATPDRDLTAALERAAADIGPSHTGSTWTIDAPYRETRTEVERYRSRGILTVEMEAAAVFAVATHRDVDAGAAFVVSDYLGEEWTQQFEEAANHHERLVDLAVETLTK